MNLYVCVKFEFAVECSIAKGHRLCGLCQRKTSHIVWAYCCWTRSYRCRIGSSACTFRVDIGNHSTGTWITWWTNPSWSSSVPLKCYRRKKNTPSMIWNKLFVLKNITDEAFSCMLWVYLMLHLRLTEWRELFLFWSSFQWMRHFFKVN